MTMSTVPFSMNGSRFAETVSTHSMPSSGMPSSDAMILPISTSKPTGFPSRPSRPNSGWSNLVPMVILPASLSSAMVVPASKSAAAGASGVSSSAPPPAHAPRARTLAVAMAEIIRPFLSLMLFSYLLLLCCLTPRGSVGKYFREEVFRSRSLRIVEELFRGRLFDDLAFGHEQHPVRSLTREAHLVGDDHHGHSVVCQLHHDVEHLADHFRVEGRGRLVEQDQFRIHRQGTGDRDALLLAAREL